MIEIVRRGAQLQTLAMAVLAASCGRINFEPLGSSGAHDGGARGDGAAADGALTAPTKIYVSTYPDSPRLYELDPATLVPSVGRDLCTNISGTFELGDIAFDANGTLIGFGFPDPTLYRVAPDFSTCTTFPIRSQGVSIGSPVKGADLVPAGGVGPARVVLIGTEDAKLYEVDTTDGSARLITSLSQPPAGDIVWAGTELLMSIATGGSDRLARIDLTTGAETPIGTIGLGAVFGLAWFDGRLYGVTSGGEVALINPTTGAAVMQINTGPTWGGAAVR